MGEVRLQAGFTGTQGKHTPLVGAYGHEDEFETRLSRSIDPGQG